MLASRHGALPLLPLLLSADPPASVTAFDKDGNTALHHASAAGELKALRLLLHYGASPLAQNAYSWTPIAYSATSAAEAYFKQLVAEFEKKWVEDRKAEREREREKERQRIAGVRLVTSEEDGAPLRERLHVRPREDSLGALPGSALEWSPIERRAMTPTEGKNLWSFGGRSRAASGD
jgi:hypothetical protein